MSHLIQLNCKIPKKYHRLFVLFLESSRHDLDVSQKGIYMKSEGVEIPGDRGTVLDWIRESVIRVRGELGDL